MSTRVSDLMSREIVSVHRRVDIRTAGRLMLENKISCLAILEDDGLVGLVTDRDFVRMADMNSEPEYIEDIMTHSPKSIDPSAMAAEAASIMGAHHVRHLVVRENGSCLGILSLRDVLVNEPNSIYSYLQSIGNSQMSERLVNFVRDQQTGYQIR